MSGLYPIEGMGIRGACNAKLNCKHMEDEEDINDDDMATLIKHCDSNQPFCLLSRQAV